MAAMAETVDTARTFSTKTHTAIKWILEDYSILERVPKICLFSQEFSITETKNARLEIVHPGIDKAAVVSLRLLGGLEAYALITDISIIDARNNTKLMTKREIFAAPSVEKSRHFSENAKLSSEISVQNDMLHNDKLTILCEIIVIESILSSPIKKICPTLPVAKINPTLPEAKPDKSCDTCTKNANNDLFYDVTFMIENTEFRAHKLVLAKHSPVFESKFEKDADDAIEVVEILKHDAITFEAFLIFIYTGNIVDIEKIVDKLLLLAHEYQVTRLVEKCQKYMIESLTISNVIDYLLIAHAHNFEDLKRRALELAKTNGEFVKCDNFHKLCQHPDLIALIIQKP